MRTILPLARFCGVKRLSGSRAASCLLQYHDEATGEYVEVFKRQCLYSLPPVLIIHLKRFEFDFDLMKKESSLCSLPRA